MTLQSLNKLKNANGVGETLKFGVGLLVGVAADMAVTALLKGHIPARRSFTGVMIRLGIFALAMKAGDDVENYFYEAVDATKDTYNKVKEEARNAMKQAMDEEDSHE